MPGAKGAEFSELQPKNDRGQLDVSFQSIPFSAEGLDTGSIAQVTPNNSFRLGQQIMLWLGVANTIEGEGGGENWITSVRLKLWWARPNMEYRQGGAANGQFNAPDRWYPIDREVFGDGPTGTLANNRYVWIPSPKRLDVTEWQTPTPPAAAEPRTSDSLLLDDVLRMELRDPNDATYQNQFPAPQIPSRWDVLFYPAMGYALGITYSATYAFTPGQGGRSRPGLLASFSWATGTLGGTNYQEAIG